LLEPGIEVMDADTSPAVQLSAVESVFSARQKYSLISLEITFACTFIRTFTI